MITIGVIGIVAAIAIPSLINHYNDKVLETKYKKAKNIIINGYKLMMSKEQVFDIKDLSVMKCQDFNCFISAHKEVFKTMRDNSSPDISEAFASDYTMSGSEQKVDYSSMVSQLPSFQTTDGMSYIVGPDDHYSMPYLTLVVDVNGKSKPNVMGEDLFYFAVYGNGILVDLMNDTCSVFSYNGCTTKGSCQALNNGYSGKGCFDWNGSRCGLDSFYCR